MFRLSYVCPAIEEESIHHLNRQHDKDDYQVIANWLTSEDYTSQQSDLFSRRQEGTGQWLLDSSEFQKWLKDDLQTLFCPGIPGAGKTVMTSIIVEYLTTKFQNHEGTAIVYLYCSYKRQQEQSPVDLLVSLLKQLVQQQPSLPESVKDLYNRHKHKGSRASFDEILKVLYAVVANYSRIFILIDALDEYQVSDHGWRRFLSEIFHLQAKAGASLFVTSRFIPDIVKEFEGSILLEIRASENDVRRCLDRQMQRLPRCVKESCGLQEKIKTEITKTVNGMYVPLYVALYTLNC
jgi:hypothetical protein